MTYPPFSADCVRPIAQTHTIGHTKCVSSTKSTKRIVTVTPNPSIDATVHIPALRRGEVVRATATRKEAGGKGINVAHAAAMAGYDATAVAPCQQSDPFATAMRAVPVAFVPVHIASAVRTNTAITEDDGTTTKVNEAGSELSDAELDAVESALARNCSGADAVALAGSLPPGAPTDWYASLVHTVRASATDAIVAVDTSDAPLLALGEHLHLAAPDVIKPKAFELAQLTDNDGRELEARAAVGDYAPVVSAGRDLVQRGIREVLVTLGSAGACLITAKAAWAATPPPTVVKSTVGAGDSSLAGYLTARIDGETLADCLRRAVAYGSAAAALPGTGLPAPADVHLDQTDVFPV